MPGPTLRVRQLGTVGYEEAFALQHAIARRSQDDYLLVLEHPHVYTMGVRADPSHILVDPASVGASVVTTDRGGDVTYHGPGQLVLYPVRTVGDDPGAGRRHVRQLEQLVIGALGDLGVGPSVQGVGRLDGYPGVWLGVEGPSPRKVAAIGVRTIRVPQRRAPTAANGGQRRSLHGVAINVRCDLAMFGHIVPCGISHLSVTSLEQEGFSFSMEEVTEAVLRRGISVWGQAMPVDRQRVTPPQGVSTVLSSKAEPQGPLRAAVEVPRAHGSPMRSGDNSGADDQGGPAPRPVPVQLHKEPNAFRRLRRAGVEPSDAMALRSPKPPWLRVPARMGQDYLELGRTVHTLGLHTVCEEAGCPNIYECWAEGTATFMINGARCTRACGFCLVDTRRPLRLDPSEPRRVADAVCRMGLAHVVVTCVARDDLSDGGAGAMAQTVTAIHEQSPQARVEVLISDYKGDEGALHEVLGARPDVVNHNIETVARLQRAVRPSAGYARSLAVLSRAADAGLVTKSGLMVGLGEQHFEVVATLADLASVGVSIATIGQYLRPSAHHLPVARWWHPEEFAQLRSDGLALGLDHVEASPLTRSSYHARGAADAAGVTPKRMAAAPQAGVLSR